MCVVVVVGLELSTIRPPGPGLRPYFGPQVSAREEMGYPRLGSAAVDKSCRKHHHRVRVERIAKP